MNIVYRPAICRFAFNPSKHGYEDSFSDFLYFNIPMTSQYAVNPRPRWVDIQGMHTKGHAR